MARIPTKLSRPTPRDLSAREIWLDSRSNSSYVMEVPSVRVTAVAWGVFACRRMCRKGMSGILDSPVGTGRAFPGVLVWAITAAIFKEGSAGEKGAPVDPSFTCRVKPGNETDPFQGIQA